MTFLKKWYGIIALFILFLLNSCDKPPQYFDELKESDLLILPKKENVITNDYQEKISKEENITN